MKIKDERPRLDGNISSKDFREFYWLKKELASFCRRNELSTAGSKVDLASRIELYIETGCKSITTKKLPTLSKFDWKTESLTLSTVITDNYRNTENVRAFFQKELGSKFKFNVRFMNWMKSNSGKTLEAAKNKWFDLNSSSKNNRSSKVIAPQFEYNTYLRDFLAANPGTTRSVGIKLWKIKKSMRGPNKYSASDLNLLEET